MFRLLFALIGLALYFVTRVLLLAYLVVTFPIMFPYYKWKGIDYWGMAGALMVGRNPHPAEFMDQPRTRY